MVFFFNIIISLYLRKENANFSCVNREADITNKLTCKWSCENWKDPFQRDI